MSSGHAMLIAASALLLAGCRRSPSPEAAQHGASSEQLPANAPRMARLLDQRQRFDHRRKEHTDAACVTCHRRDA